MDTSVLINKALTILKKENKITLDELATLDNVNYTNAYNIIEGFLNNNIVRDDSNGVFINIASDDEIKKYRYANRDWYRKFSGKDLNVLSEVIAIDMFKIVSYCGHGVTLNDVYEFFDDVYSTNELTTIICKLIKYQVLIRFENMIYTRLLDEDYYMLSDMIKKKSRKPNKKTLLDDTDYIVISEEGSHEEIHEKKKSKTNEKKLLKDFIINNDIEIRLDALKTPYELVLLLINNLVVESLAKLTFDLDAAILLKSDNRFFISSASKIGYTENKNLIKLDWNQPLASQMQKAILTPFEINLVIQIEVPKKLS